MLFSNSSALSTGLISSMTIKRLLLASIVVNCAAMAALTADESTISATNATVSDIPADAITLFNGRDLSAWVIEGTKETKGEPKQPIWSVRDGLLHCQGGGFGFLRYDREFCDFVLHVEYRLTKGCNSGIGIRHAKYTGRAATRPSYSGYEIQLLDDGGKQPTKGSTASLYRYVAPKSLPIKKPGEWNTIEIECRGPKIKITLNDELIQDVDQSTIDEIKAKPLCGYLSVQNHGKEIDFRNLWVTDLTASKATNSR
jgi:hypothetical protein